MSKPIRYVNIARYEQEGWCLMRDADNRHGKRCIVQKPLSSLPTEELPKPETAAEPKTFEFVPAFRDQDENGKPFCRKCGHKLTAAKTPYCPWCGGKFVEEDE